VNIYERLRNVCMYKKLQPDKFFMGKP